MRRLFLLAGPMLLVSGCGSSSGGGSGLVIGAQLVSFLPGQAPPGYLSATVVVGNPNTGEVVPDARVTVNGVVLSFDPGGGQYVGNVDVSPGAQVKLTVAVTGRSYSASATQFSTYPTIATPASGTRWSAVCDKTVVWTPGSPESGASYAVSVLRTDLPDAAPIYQGQPVPAPATQTQVGQLSVAGQTDALLALAIVREVSIPDADTRSVFIVGGAQALPVTLDPTLKDLTSIAVAPADFLYPQGATISYAATGTYCDGTTGDLQDGVSWASSNAGAAIMVDAGPTANTLGRGQTSISAQVGTVTGSTSLTVQGMVQDAGNSDDLVAVGWSGSAYVALGRMGTILSSSDGVHWADRSVADTRGVSLNGLTFSGNLFVVVGCPTAGLDSKTAALTSPDGTAWTVQDAGLRDQCLYGVAWTGGEFVAVGTTGTVVTSGDGVVWASQDAGLSERVGLAGVAASGTRLVAVGNDNFQAPVIIVSDDGRRWASRDLGIDAGAALLALNAITWSGTQFVAVGSGAVGSEGGLIVTSPDGDTWTRQASGTGLNAMLYGVATTGTHLLAMGFYSGVLRSADGVTWTPFMSAGESVHELLAAAGSDTQFVLVGGFGTVVTGP